MTNPNNFRTHQADGQDRQMIPLRIPEQMLVKSVADGAAIALLLKQADDQHECQWGFTREQAKQLTEMLQQAQGDMDPQR